MSTRMHACNCIGPQNGNPLCPCMMRGVSIRDGHYVRIEDLGPVVKRQEPSVATVECRKCGTWVRNHNFCSSCGAKL